eukprot:174122-Ditylum_brightwellii.AAC.1
MVQYQLQADDGTEIVLKLKAYYVPDMQMSLISPQDAGKLLGNPIKFSAFTPYKGRNGYAQLEVKQNKNGWEDLQPIKTKRMELHPRTNFPCIM